MSLLLCDMHWQGFPKANDQDARVREFMLYLDKLPDETIVLGGDFFDSVPYSFFESCWRFRVELQKLAQKKRIIWALGNHDAPLQLLAPILRWEVKEKPFVFVDENGNRWWVQHGHRLDGVWSGPNAPMTRPLGHKYSWGNAFLAGAIALERLIPGLDNSFQGLVQKYKMKHTARGVLVCDAVFVAEALDMFEEDPSLDGYAFGHTHRVLFLEVLPGKFVVNPGGWTENETGLCCCYFRFEEKMIKEFTMSGSRNVAGKDYAEVCDGTVDTGGSKETTA